MKICLFPFSSVSFNQITFLHRKNGNHYLRPIRKTDKYMYLYTQLECIRETTFLLNPYEICMSMHEYAYTNAILR